MCVVAPNISVTPEAVSVEERAAVMIDCEADGNPDPSVTWTTPSGGRGCLYTYTVSRVTYTDEYHACIWTSLGEFRYERYESVYVTLLTV